MLQKTGQNNAYWPDVTIEICTGYADSMRALYFVLGGRRNADDEEAKLRVVQQWMGFKWIMKDLTYNILKYSNSNILDGSISKGLLLADPEVR